MIFLEPISKRPILDNLGVRLKIYSSKYYIYSCGYIYHLPWSCLKLERFETGSLKFYFQVIYIMRSAVSDKSDRIKEAQTMYIFGLYIGQG